jgi:hypothetical protein
MNTIQTPLNFKQNNHYGQQTNKHWISKWKRQECSWYSKRKLANLAHSRCHLPSQTDMYKTHWDEVRCNSFFTEYCFDVKCPSFSMLGIIPYLQFTPVAVLLFIEPLSFPIMPAETLKMVYNSYFHSLLIYGIIFWGNSSFSMHVFWIQKRIIRVMSGLRPRDSCIDAFRNWGILLLQSQYIFSLLIFVVNNMGLYHR